MPSPSPGYLTTCKDTSVHQGGHRDRDRKEWLPMLSPSFAHLKGATSFLAQNAIFYSAKQPPRLSETGSTHWRNCQNVKDVFSSMPWTSKQKAFILHWKDSVDALVSLGWQNLGTAGGYGPHLWCQSRKENPISGIYYFIAIDFYILCGL